MKYRRAIFKQLFKREHFAMKMYYSNQKNKKLRLTAKKFEGLIDE
jgi:hypothetical protein